MMEAIESPEMERTVWGAGGCGFSRITAPRRIHDGSDRKSRDGTDRMGCGRLRLLLLWSLHDRSRTGRFRRGGRTNRPRSSCGFVRNCRRNRRSGRPRDPIRARNRFSRRDRRSGNRPVAPQGRELRSRHRLCGIIFFCPSPQSFIRPSSTLRRWLDEVRSEPSSAVSREIASNRKPTSQSAPCCL